MLNGLLRYRRNSAAQRGIARGRHANVISRWTCCRQGAAAVEFGILAPLFIALMLGVMEFGSLMYAQAAVEAGARMSSRFGITGKQDESDPDAWVGREVSEIRDRVLDFGFGLAFDEDRLKITPRVYPTYDAIPEPFTDLNGNGVWDAGEPFSDLNGDGVWNGGVGVPGVGGSDEIVLYEIQYEWRPLTPLTSWMMTGEASGSVFINAYSVVRNEPWDGGGGGLGG